ncbi:MAG: hypothetical protein AAFQ87_11560 [Bacteroidota bacterium]
MKTLMLLSLSLLLSLPSFAQKGGKTLKRSELRALNVKIQQSKASAKYKALMGSVLVAQNSDSDDCTPPPCNGIIDPWTCECYPDIKDPWEDDKVKRQIATKRINSFNQAETLASSAHGGPITPQMVSAARKRFPGQNYAAMIKRLSYYQQALR